MKKYSLERLIEYDDAKFHPKVLINEPGYRMVLLSLRAGQSVPEHANPGIVTVHCIHGHISFYEKSVLCELRVGDVLCVEPGAPHRVEAIEDSVLFVLATGKTATPGEEPEELDVREVTRPQRHPLIFAKLDALAVGESFVLINDHDPVPLSKLIEDLRPGQIAWEYNQRGPSIFRIRIQRVAHPAASDLPIRPPPATTGIART